MARQHIVYRSLVYAALHHAEDVYLIGVAREGTPAVDRERHIHRYLNLVVVAHRRQHLFSVSWFDALPVKFRRQYLRAAVSVVEARAVLKGLIVAVLRKPRRVVQQPDGVGGPGVVFLVPLKRLRDRRGQPLYAEAVFSLELLHRRKSALYLERINVSVEPFFCLFTGIHHKTPPISRNYTTVSG